MAIPRIISGMNLDFFAVGKLLKRAGAIWIRRSFKSDKLYQAVFKAYIHSLLSYGTLLECFIEGGRSRVGKVLSPKIGFLQTIINILINDKNLWSSDIKLIPIAISYDKLMESGAYTSEMLGNEKKSESFGGFINAANKVLKLTYGSINIQIGDIISMKQKILQRSSISNLSKLKHKIYIENDKNLIKNICLKLAHEVLYEMNFLTSITVSSAIATILLTECIGNSSKKGISVKLLGQKISNLIKLVKQRNGKIANIFTNNNNNNDNNYDNVVDKALNVMTKIIINRDGIVMVNNDNAYLELAMYRNNCIHYFIHESLVSIAMISLFDNNNNINDYFYQNNINKGDIMQRTQFLSRLLKHEFIYKPSVSFVQNFEETLDFMIENNILSEEWINNTNIIKINDGYQDIMHFLAMLIWPFIDIYWIISICLKSLLPNKILSQKEFTEICSKNAEIKYFEGEIQFFEVVGVHSINNAIKWFKSTKILITQNVQIGKSTFLTQSRGTTVSVFQLSELYRTQNAIDELTNVINSYRKPNNNKSSSSQHSLLLTNNNKSKL